MAAAIQDLTYVSQVRVVDGVEQARIQGVRAAAVPRSCPAWPNPCTSSSAVEDYLRVALAIWTVFNNADMLRKNRMMARLKVLIDRIGLDEFRDLVEAELAEDRPH